MESTVVQRGLCGDRVRNIVWKSEENEERGTRHRTQPIPPGNWSRGEAGRRIEGCLTRCQREDWEREEHSEGQSAEDEKGANRWEKDNKAGRSDTSPPARVLINSKLKKRTKGQRDFPQYS